MRHSIFIFFVFTVHIFFAQNKEIKKFVLPGYDMLDTLSGDLNLDGRKDVLLVLKIVGEDTMQFSEEARPLLLLIKQTDGTYSKVGLNDEVVMCKGCGGVFGDPYVGLAIKNGYFSIEHYGGSSWRWSDIVTFHYDKKLKKWFLSRWGVDSYHISDPDKRTTEIKTPKQFGIVEFAKFTR